MDIPGPPTKVTLRKYGLTAEEWEAMWRAQQGLCPICVRPMVNPNIDHRHVRRWKSLPAEQRRLWVRGLVCARCNRYVLGPEYFGVTSAMLRRAADWVDRHDQASGMA